MTHLTESILRERFSKGAIPIKNNFTKPLDTKSSVFYNDFALRVKRCVACGLAERRSWLPVTPHGDLTARVCVIGRCPSFREGCEGHSFPKGSYRYNLMQEYKRIFGIEQEPLWYSYATYCDCGTERPSCSEIACCRAYKAMELSMLERVDVIFLWGLSAVRSLLDVPYTHISDVLGYTYETVLANRTAWLIPTLHPISLGWRTRVLGRWVNECLSVLVRDTLAKKLTSAVRVMCNTVQTGVCDTAEGVSRSESTALPTQYGHSTTETTLSTEGHSAMESRLSDAHQTPTTGNQGATERRESGNHVRITDNHTTTEPTTVTQKQGGSTVVSYHDTESTPKCLETSTLHRTWNQVTVNKKTIVYNNNYNMYSIMNCNNSLANLSMHNVHLIT